MDDSRLQLLATFTPEGKLTPGYGDSYLFLVGRDDCHGILHWLIPQEKQYFRLNMFGYDDEELNYDVLDLFKDPAVHVQISLDRSQAAGIHEKKIIEADQQKDPADFSSSFCILESETHQISHTKGGVLSGLGIYFEGSMNWSNSGEGYGISLKLDATQPRGFKAQNNTLLVSTNPVNLRRFADQLDVEHKIGLAQATNNKRKGN